MTQKSIEELFDEIKDLPSRDQVKEVTEFLSGLGQDERKGIFLHNQRFREWLNLKEIKYGLYDPNEENED